MKEEGPVPPSNEVGPEPATPMTREAALIEALQRIGASLDLDTVLREVLQSARALTGAGSAVITTLDAQGAVQDFVTSGFSPAARRKMLEWPDGLRLFEQLRALSSPLSVADLGGYFETLGLSPCPWGATTMQVAPLHHRGEHLGTFFLGDKANHAAFTAEDEKLLVLFAAQAAAAIAHARAYRDEQRVRADLEALIETSPVGVLVFDAASGHLVSLNREAKRIVEPLRQPGHPTEDLLQTITYQRADGREIALDQFPLALELRQAETVRAEEILLSVPEGGRVTVLANVTPIRAEDGTIVSVVVTMQDLAPFERLERMRTEFLGMVSHELRAPLTSIKGSAATLLESASELDPAERHAFFRIIAEQADHMRSLISDLLDAGRIDAGTLSVSPEPSPLAALVDRARTTFLSGGGRHSILLDLPPDLPPVLADRQRLVQVLSNLLANAARHAPESSSIRVTAARDGVHVAVSVTDEGRGIAPEQLPTLFRKDVGARGLGLAICKGLVEAQGGRIRAESDGVGLGTRITFTIPVAEDAAGDVVTTPPRPRRDDGTPARILVVDDDPEALRYIRHTLTAAGYVVLVTGAATELTQILETEHPQLVLLDLVLPGIDGLELMERVPQLADRPVIFISGYGHDETVARAFEAGAEDYLVKPFSPTELTARVRAALRRRAEPDPFVLGDLAIDYDRRVVRVAGREIALTTLEYALLRELALAAGRVVDYETLLRRVWNKRSYSNPQELVRSYVKRLRRKLGDDPQHPAYFVTVRGVGYRMRRAKDA